jgi:hypothetical protein
VRPIPAIWRIDVEPDESDNRPEPTPPPWSGFTAMVELVEELRPRLADRAGVPPHPTWFLRLDPNIERCFGQADFVVERHRGPMDRLRAHGDALGIHVHCHRWDERRQATYSDYADADWVAYCVDVAAKTFERCFRESVRRSSQGGYFLDETVIDRAIAAGIEVDVTAEPGLVPHEQDRAFGSYATAPSTDFRGFPRRPYYPSRAAVGRSGVSCTDRRPILIVPLTAYDYETALAPWHRRMVKRALGRPRQHLPLNPWKEWSHPREFWDLVARAADEGPARYVAFAIRTDYPRSDSFHRMRALFEYLPRHPLGAQLRFVDPLAPEIRALAEVNAGASA